MFFDINLADLRLDLRFEFIGSAFKFVERAPYLTANLWKLLGAKDEKSQQEQENHL